jgi:hypothetical protein
MPKIQVTEDDIARATRNHSMRCVVVQAIARTRPNARRIEVDTQTIKYTEGEERFVYLTPPMAQLYVIDFDAGKDIDPFNFVLSERHRIPARQQVRTDKGKAAQVARGKRRRAIAKVRKATEAKAAATEPAEVRAATKALREAKAEAKVAGADVTQAAALPGPETQRKTPTTRPAPKRTWKRTSAREYGMRTLRVNQARAGAASDS